MKVQLEAGVWIADWEGDPGRTLAEENAKKFASITEAQTALTESRKYRPFKNAIIQEGFSD